MTFIQDWAALTNTTAAVSRTQTGDTTLSGSTLFLDVFIRTSSDAPVVTVTDDGANGSNTWELLSSIKNGSANLYSFISRDSEAITSVTASWGASLPGIIFLSEFDGVGDLVGLETLLDQGSPTSITGLDAGYLFRGILGVQVSDRTYTKQDTGISTTDRAYWRGSQIEVRRADGYSDGVSSSASVGWNLTTGSAADETIINMAFDVAAVPPPPLFMHRVESSGVTPLLFGIVTPTGVDTGQVVTP